MWAGHACGLAFGASRLIFPIEDGAPPLPDPVVYNLSLDEATLPENPAERRAYRSALRKLALRRACFSLPRPARSPASHSNARHAHRAPRASRFAPRSRLCRAPSGR